MKALSFRQPWGWAITDLELPLAKRLENRVWRNLKNGLSVNSLGFKEYFAIHASATKPKDFDVDGVMTAAGIDYLGPEASLPSSILGVAQIITTLRATEGLEVMEGTADKPFPHYQMREEDRHAFLHDVELELTLEQREEQLRRWWMGPYAFVLTNVKKLKTPVSSYEGAPVKGALNFWMMPAGLTRLVEEQL